MFDELCRGCGSDGEGTYCCFKKEYRDTGKCNYYIRSFNNDKEDPAADAVLYLLIPLLFVGGLIAIPLMLFC